MTAVKELTDRVLASSLAPRVVEAVQDALKKEQAAREAFYEKVQPHHKWEFIQGEIVMHSPVRTRHLEASMALALMLRTFTLRDRLGVIYVEKALVALTRNDYEPDICFYKSQVAQGFAPDQMKFPAPQLVAEILSPSTEANDRGIKFEDYQNHGVEEYWIVDPDGETVEQYLLREGIYVLQAKKGDGAIRSQVIAGLELPVRAIFDAEAQRDFLAGLQQS